MEPNKNGLDLRRSPIIVIKPLGREKAYGLAEHPVFSLDKRLLPVLQIDKGTRGKQRMKIALHEAAHIACPGLPEEHVVRISAFQAKVLAALGYHGDDDEMDAEFAGRNPNDD